MALLLTLTVKQIRLAWVYLGFGDRLVAGASVNRIDSSMVFHRSVLRA